MNNDIPTGDRSDDSGTEHDGDLFAVSVRIIPAKARELYRRHDLDFGDRPHIRPNPDGTGMLELQASRRQVDELRSAGYELDVGVNLSAAGRERSSDVGEGDQFELGDVVPRGFGRRIGGRSPDRDPGSEG